MAIENHAKRLNSKESCYWHVVYVKPKSERQANKKLQIKGFETYLPLVTMLREYKSQKKKVERPLFPGYLFVNVMPGKRHHVTSVTEIYSFIRFKDEFAKVKDEEIRNLQIALANEGNAELIESQKFLKRGKKVEVIAGPFTGLSGKTVGVKSKKIQVQVNAIQSAFSIIVSPSYLKFIN